METDGLGQSAVAQPRWDQLEASLPEGRRLAVRIALPGRTPDVLIAVDAARCRHILVRIPPGEEEALSQRISRGIEVATARLFAHDAGIEETFVEVKCVDPQGHSALDLVVGELVDAVETAVERPRVKLVQGVLSRWRRFWSGVPSGALDFERQIGLFGELCFLGRWLLPALGPARAVAAWRGPDGARNDFELPRLAIEAKTTGRIDGAVVIHGLEQLLAPADGALWLFGLAVRNEASAVESLPRIVAELREGLRAEPEAASAFEAALFAAGYDSRHESDYARHALRVRSAGLYRVSDDFPRLIPSSLSSGVPAGIDGIRYELRLDAATPWLVASNSASALKLIRDFAGL